MCFAQEEPLRPTQNLYPLLGPHAAGCVQQVDHLLWDRLPLACSVLSAVPSLLWDAFTVPTLVSPTDEQLHAVLTSNPISTMHLPLTDAERTTLALAVRADDAATAFKVDFTFLDKMRPVDGCMALPPLLVFLTDTSLVAIERMQGDRRLCTARNTPAREWDELRTFLATALVYKGTFWNHPLNHFTTDTVAVETQRALPLLHPVRALLQPHLRFTVPLDSRVLNSPVSVIAEHSPLFVYAYDRREIVEHIFKAAYVGFRYVEDYESKLSPTGFMRRYGDLLRPYDLVVRAFVQRVVDHAGVDSWTRGWADRVSAQVSGFPDGPAIARDPAWLVRALTAIIMRASVVHTYEHEWAGTDWAEQPWLTYRLRAGPDGRIDFRASRTRADRLMQRVAVEAFYRSHPATLMKDVQYALPEHCTAGFRRDFLAVDCPAMPAVRVGQSISF